MPTTTAANCPIAASISQFMGAVSFSMSDHVACLPQSQNKKPPRI
jgi:hypothetical protein